MRLLPLYKNFFFLITCLLFVFSYTSSANAFGECSEYGYGATYDSWSKTCKCSYGYVWDSTYSGAECVSCTSKYGYGSTYDSVTESCECKSGYVVGTDLMGDATCVDADTVCTKKYGYNSEYDTLSDSCKCSYGYIFVKDILGNLTCAKEDAACTEKYGYNSEYDSLTKSCKCKSGYIFEKDTLGDLTCILKDSACIEQYGKNVEYDSISKKCICHNGYVWDSTYSGDKCVSCTEKFGVGAISNSLGECVCKNGYVLKKNSLDKDECITNNQACINEFGEFTQYDSTADKCECDTGYVIDNGKCKEGDFVCEMKYGLYSSYNSNMKKCQCDSGYYLDSYNKCTKEQIEVLPSENNIVPKELLVIPEQKSESIQKVKKLYATDKKELDYSISQSEKEQLAQGTNQNPDEKSLTGWSKIKEIVSSFFKLFSSFME